MAFVSIKRGLLSPLEQTTKTIQLSFYGVLFFQELGGKRETTLASHRVSYVPKMPLSKTTAAGILFPGEEVNLSDDQIPQMVLYHFLYVPWYTISTCSAPCGNKHDTTVVGVESWAPCPKTLFIPCVDILHGTEEPAASETHNKINQQTFPHYQRRTSANTYCRLDIYQHQSIGQQTAD